MQGLRERVAAKHPEKYAARNKFSSSLKESLPLILFLCARPTHKTAPLRSAGSRGESSVGASGFARRGGRKTGVRLESWQEIGPTTDRPPERVTGGEFGERESGSALARSASE